MSENFSEQNPERGFQPEQHAEEIERAEKMRNELYNRGGMAFHEAVVDKAEQLKSKYPNFEEYRLYHLLISSTPSEGEVFPNFDFPGEDSIIKFLEDKISSLDK